MKSLKRFDPIDQSLENFMRNFFGNSLLEEASDKLAIRIDVSENDEAYTVHAEMPGLKKEDIQVSVDGNQVTISAETRKEEERKKNGRLLHRELYYGSLYRSFSLAQPVNESQAKASYKDGVLELCLPKGNAPQMKQLTVQ